MRSNRPKGLMWPLMLGAACGGGFQRGAPIPDADAIAQRLRDGTGAAGPMQVVFEWEYADERGNFRGDGAARVNPPDRFRLDLFATGEGSMQATLVDGELRSGGDLDGIELPPTVFLYAMAGVFRPPARAPLSGFESREYRVLEFEAAGGGRQYFYVSGDRLVRVEQRRANRLERRIELQWGADATWPREARYRDEIAPSGVRWELVRSTPQGEPYDETIYLLPPRR